MTPTCSGSSRTRCRRWAITSAPPATARTTAASGTSRSRLGTQDESLRTKPSCQADYVEKYRKVVLPQPQLPRYRRFYYYLHKLVDLQVARLLRRLDASRFRDDTIEGLDQTTVIGRPYEAVEELAKVEAVLARLDVGEGPRLWKYARAYRRSQVGDASRLPERCEEELYDLEADPLET